MNPNDFPALDQFFGCWFHEDFGDEAEDDVGVVRAFRQMHSEQFVGEVRAELARFIELPLSDPELLNVLYRDLKSHYYLADPSQTRPWLRRILGAMS